MLKRLIITLLSFSVLCTPGYIFAAPYGGGLFGSCNFNEGCAPPVQSTPEPVPDPTPSEPPSAPPAVSREIDGKQVTATDQNTTETDGYEAFSSENNAVVQLAAVDGDRDGKTDFILNMDDDEFPERYWDPDNDLISTIQLTDCDQDGEAEWRFDVGDEVRTYDPSNGEFIEDCSTPSQPGTNPGSTGQNPGSSGRGNQGPGKDNRLTNILPLISNNAVYQSVGEAIKKVPEPIAYGFPYALLFVILLLVIRLIMQSRQEVNRLVVAARTQEAEKQLALEKENFMMLSSHYLRTPITIINGNIELMASLKQITEEVSQALSTAGKVLLGEVSSLLDRVEQDKKLAAIKASTNETRMTTFISPRLILPLILIITALLMGQFLFVDFKVVSPNIVNSLVQILLAALLIQTFLAKLRQRQLNRHNRLDQERVLSEQRALDQARSEFITNVANGLESQVNQFNQQLAPVIDKPEAQKVKRALGELAGMVAKFRLVAFLQGQHLDASKTQFGLRELVNESVLAYSGSANARQITFNESIEDGQIFQQKQLLSIILNSLLDNAVKYSTDNSTIEVRAKNDHGKSVFQIQDSGKGIPKEKQELLFKPFSRTESAEVFNTEGLGFSLYLDKMIATYLRGDIAVDSDENKGTVVTVSVPSTA